MKNILFLLLILTITACSNNKYEYIQINIEDNLSSIEKTEDESKVIYAENDSIAYMKAYDIYCKALEVNHRMAASNTRLYQAVKDFKLVGKGGYNIRNTTIFDYKDSLELEIQKKYININTTGQDINSFSKTHSLTE
jgi:hypothetical protein